MSVTISMEKGLTLTKNVSIKIITHNVENKTMDVALDGKIHLVVSLLEGTPEEIAELMKSNCQLTINGEIIQKSPSSTSSTSSTTRSGCSKYPPLNTLT